MANESSDPITAALIETEKEVAGFAWDNEDTEASDPSGDQSLEDMGDGLEGQHEAEDDEGAEGVEEPEEEAVAAKTEEKPVEEPKPVEQPQGRVPPGKHREALERARAAEVERDTIKAAFERDQADSKAKFDLLMREIAAIKASPHPGAIPKAPEPPKPAPDIFENPTGFIEHITQQFQSELNKRDTQLQNQRVETSMALAHGFHKDTFEKAWAAVNALDVNDPDARSTVQRIYASPNPGEALVKWHRRNEVLSFVGDDPVAYRERIRKEEREAMEKDPEFRKRVIAELRGEASTGDNGQPRTITRLPGSLARAPGSNVGANRSDPNDMDDSQQGIADAAWR
jgi:hypothetical protein